MVQVDRLHLHFSALLLDYRENYGAVCFSLVSDNAVAPKEIKSKPRKGPPRRAKSTGRIVREKPQPTRQTPKRSSSADDVPPSSSCCSRSRWISETGCGGKCLGNENEAAGVPNQENHHSVTLTKRIVAPKVPLRSLDENDIVVAPQGAADANSSLPPRLPKRSTSVPEDWTSLSPEIPLRRPEARLPGALGLHQ